MDLATKVLVWFGLGGFGFWQSEREGSKFLERERETQRKKGEGSMILGFYGGIGSDRFLLHVFPFLFGRRRGEREREREL